MRHARLLPIILVIIFLLAACDAELDAPAAEAPAAEAPVAATVPQRTAATSTKAVEIAELFADFVDDETPGAAVLVSQEDQLLYTGGFGLADLEDGTPISAQTSFHLGSVGKQFTALGIMMLAEQGELDFDDAIGDHLPDLPWGGQITIRQLLNHVSGVPDYDEDSDVEDALFADTDTPGNDDLLAALAQQDDVANTPGDAFAYSNTGYDLLGVLIEQVSGETYADFMQENVFAPLKMTHSFAQPKRPRASDWVAHSYTEEDGDIVAYDEDPLDGLNGSGSIYASVDDLFRYDQALFGGELVDLDTFAEAIQPTELNDGELSYYGFGWELDADDENVISHSGAWLAFQSCYVHYMEEQFSVIVLFNQDYEDADPCEIAFEIAGLYE
ncbi:MAG: beta-lactamase family protein [Caldilineaceae bacterium]|nr:beta-lactamase family protein [Caldilineaceae bacterium]